FILRAEAADADLEEEVVLADAIQETREIGVFLHQIDDRVQLRNRVFVVRRIWHLAYHAHRSSHPWSDALAPDAIILRVQVLEFFELRIGDFLFEEVTAGSTEIGRIGQIDQAEKKRFAFLSSAAWLGEQEFAEFLDPLVI